MREILPGVEISNMRTRIVGNNITDVSLGVYQALDSETLILKGCLFSLNSILAVDFVSNNMTNIAGFTLEDLRIIILKIKNERTTLELKEQFPFALTTNPSFNLRDSTFFTNYLSNTLITIHSMCSLRFLGRSTFQNIYMIDRLLAMLEQRAS